MMHIHDLPGPAMDIIVAHLDCEERAALLLSSREMYMRTFYGASHLCIPQGWVVPERLLGSLTTKHIKELDYSDDRPDVLVRLLHRLPALRTLRVDGKCPVHLIPASSLPATLKRLELVRCVGVRTLPHPLPELTELIIRDVYQLHFLPPLPATLLFLEFNWAHIPFCVRFFECRRQEVRHRCNYTRRNIIQTHGTVPWSIAYHVSRSLCAQCFWSSCGESEHGQPSQISSLQSKGRSSFA